MYKGSAYSGYPFLMLSDPYLPNGSMSPLVSSSSPHGEVLWPLSLLKYVAGIVQAPTHAFFLTNWSPVSEIPGHCSLRVKGEALWGRGKRCSAGSACFSLNLLEELLFQSPYPLDLALLFQQSNPSISWKNVPSFFWVTKGRSSSWSLCLCSGICPAAEFESVKQPGSGMLCVRALLWMMAQKMDLVLLKWQ